MSSEESDKLFHQKLSLSGIPMFGKLLVGLAFAGLSLITVNCTSPLSPNSLNPNSGSISFVVSVDTGELEG